MAPVGFSFWSPHKGRSLLVSLRLIFNEALGSTEIKVGMFKSDFTNFRLVIMRNCASKNEAAALWHAGHNLHELFRKIPLNCHQPF